ncbi:hypothetical protein EMCRGX_G015245 [Ephydatia muelleri]
MLENYAQANFALQDSNPSALQGRSRKKKASVRDSYKADPEKKKASDSYKADPEKKKAFVCDSYKADPEKKKASVRDSYNADIESKQSAKKQRYQEDLEENRAAKRQRYQEDVEENRAAKRPKYEDNSAAIKASERNRYWYDPAVRLAKRAAERKRYRRGHRTTTTTQSYSLYEPKSHALMEYNGGLEKAILRDSELLSEVNDAFCKSHPLLAQKVVTRYARAAPPLLDTLLPPYCPPPAAAAALPLPSRAAPTAAPPPTAELPPPPAAEAGPPLPAPAPPPAPVLAPVPPPPLCCCHPGRCHHHPHGSHGQNQAAAAIEEAGGDKEDKAEPRGLCLKHGAADDTGQSSIDGWDADVGENSQLREIAAAITSQAGSDPNGSSQMGD